MTGLLRRLRAAGRAGGRWRRPGATGQAPGPPDAEAVRALAARWRAAGHDRSGWGRGLGLLHVDAGGCAGCASELGALAGPDVDLARLGLGFVATPRHADVLLVTGPVTRNLREALAAAYAAMPGPKLVVAIGDCAIDGGVFRGGPAVLDGAASVVPVDLVIRGCPPTPAQIFDGLRVVAAAWGAAG